MTNATTNGSLVSLTVSDGQPLVNPDGTGTTQFRQFLRSLRRVGQAADPAAIATLQAQVAALQAQVAALQTLTDSLLEIESGP